VKKMGDFRCTDSVCGKTYYSATNLKDLRKNGKRDDRCTCGKPLENYDITQGK